MKRKSSSAMLGLALVLALASFWVASPVAAAPARATGTNTNAIVIHAQDTNNGQVVVNSVTAAQVGWILIRRDDSGVLGGVLGFAAVHQGVNTNVLVDIKTGSNANGKELVTPTLWAELVANPNALDAFASPDVTVEQEGSLAMAGFSSTAAGGAAIASVASQTLTTGGASSPSASKANKITVRAQDASMGQVFIDSMTAAQDGWILIRRDANGAPGAVIGFAPVLQGVNTNVRVDIQLTNSKGNSNITPILWATLVSDPSAAEPFQSPSSDVQQESPLVKATFSSSVTGGATQ